MPVIGRTQTFIHACVHIQREMGTKTISITDEAYEALSREKKGGESFTEAILRLTRKTGNLADCLGTWTMTAREEKAIRKEVAEGWRQSRGRQVRAVP